MKKQKNKEIKYISVLCVCAGLILGFIWMLLPSNRPETIYKSFLTFTNNGSSFLYEDNLYGRIAWNQQYFMESLIYMYEVTGAAYYLDLFTQQADYVFALRADKTGHRDFSNQSRPGWLT